MGQSLDKSGVSCYTLAAPSLMRHFIPRFLSAALAAGALLAGACSPPKYASYKSPQGDFKLEVPWGWLVMNEAEGTRFTNANFIGGFEPDFFLGAPSFSVRWHSYYDPRKLPGGRLEMFSSVDDYIKQMLADVYAPRYFLATDIQEVPLKKAKKQGKMFVVQSPAPIAPNSQFGVVYSSRTGEGFNLRKHAYVILPMTRGFYVMIYPATRDGFPKFEKQFIHLIESFLPLTDGPGGAGFSAKAR